MRHFILMVLIIGAAAGAVAGADTTDWLSAAAHEAAMGRLDVAEENYRKAVEAAPEDGRPALARFYRLTAQQEKLDALIGEMAELNLSPVIQARTLAAAGRMDEAVERLESAGPLDAKAAVMLAGLHKRRGQTQKAGEVLWSALKLAASDEDKATLFNAMRESGALLAGDSPTSIVLAADWGLRAIEPERKLAVEWFDPMLIELQHHAHDYFKDRELILMGGDAGPGAAWLAARLLVREERHDDAMKYMQQREGQWRDSPLWPLLAEELAEQARILGRPDDTERYLKLWAEHGGERGSAERDFRQAELAMARKDWPQAMALFSAINPEPLRPEQQRAVKLQWMRAAVEAGELTAAVDVYGRVAPGMSLEDIETLHKLIFDRWILTEWHWALEHAVRDIFAKSPEAAPELWLLAAEAAKQARLTPNQIDALYRYVLLRPGDMAVLVKLGEAVRPVAEELAAVDEKDLAAPPGERDRLTALAEQSLRRLIQSLPYEPEHYQALIEMYKAMGRDDEARRVPEIVTKDTSNVQVLGVAGYALALSGYPEEAMKYYDRALALEPGNMTVRMNRVACLTRIDRIDEAATHYRELLEKGHNGRGFHAHELVGRLWAIAQHQEKEPECLAYFESLPERIKGDWLGEAMLTAANAAATNGRLDAAKRLIEKLEATGRAPDQVVSGWENYALALVEAGRLEEADSVLSDLLKEHGGRMDRDVPLMHARAEIMKRRGLIADAIDKLREVAQMYPAAPEAKDGLFRAGDWAGESGDFDLALTMYEEFLKTGSTSFALRQEAEDKLKALRQTTGAK